MLLHKIHNVDFGEKKSVAWNALIAAICTSAPDSQIISMTLRRLGLTAPGNINDTQKIMNLTKARMGAKITERV
jgi:hypothetical protein